MSSAARPPEPGPARQGGLARRLERTAKRILSRALASIAPAPPIAPGDIAALRVRRLLVVRQHNQMGDMVCALPALRALRRAWPEAHLTFVAAPLCEELLRDHPDVDTLLVFRKQEMWLPWHLAAFVRLLRRPRPDLAVVMTTVSFSTTSALLAWASGARVRVGASSLPFGWHLSRAVYNLELPLAPEGPHEVEHNLAPLRALGIAAPLERPVLAARAEAIQRARDTLAAGFGAARERHEGRRDPLVVAHPGAGKLPNCWPAEGFAAVLRALQESRRVQVVLVEGPRDAEPVAAVGARLETALRWRAPLGDTLGLLALADLVLCNDSGMAHVAAALGAPTLALFGPTDPERWKPPGDHVHILRSPTGNLADLDAAAVLQECLWMLGAAPATPPRAGAHHPA